MWSCRGREGGREGGREEGVYVCACLYMLVYMYVMHEK